MNNEIPECAICQDYLTKNLCTTKCGHVFHKYCIEKSIKQKSTCPLCWEKCKDHQLTRLNFQMPNFKNLDEEIECFKKINIKERNSIPECENRKKMKKIEELNYICQ